ncbi:outer membrane protein assembly factor BamA [Marinobacteraceae bacterium S3BR75-40.1]
MRRTALRLVAILTLLLASMTATADNFVVSDIEVQGLQRVSAGTIFSSLPIAIGDEVAPLDVAEGIRALFDTGLFTDIEIARDDNVLVVRVQERPAISKIDIEGNQAIETEQLKDALSKAGLEEGQVFKRATLERIELEILRSYVAQGRYSASVKAEVENQERNRVAIKLKINEGEIAAIHHINIVGNKAFSDETLISLMELENTSWWNSITNSDKYSREKLSGDMERIRSYYLDRGYINFTVESTQVSISPDKKQVFITLSVNEGAQYTVGDINIKGKLIVPEEELRKLLLMEKGEVFSREKLTLTEELLAKRLGKEGYTFANVNGVPQTHDDNTATLNFFVEPGRRTYVRRINFFGNTATHDEVLRQEMVQMEGAVASTDLIEGSKTQLERLGFFKTVNVETPAVPGTSDQIDVNYSVEEQPTGSLSASLGFSQSSGFIVGANVSEKNFFGTGKRVSFGLNVSDSVKSANFSFLDPYYTVDGVSRGFSLFAKQTDYANENLSSFVLDNYGGKVTFGYPIDNLSRLEFGYGYEHTRVKVGQEPAQEISAFLDDNGNQFNTYTVNGAWVRNSLNRGVFPTKGFKHSFSVEVAVPGSDLTYYKASHLMDFYQPIDRDHDWVFRAKSNIRFGDGLWSTKTLPFYENYFAGGYGSVRGYKANTLGPRSTPHPLDFPTPDPFGGNVSIEGSLQMIVPTPFASDIDSMRTTVFLDGGNVFDTDRGYDPSLGELRYSAGVGLQWITAIGPLAFSLAQPLNDEPGDETQIFQFSLGQQF